MMDRAAFQGGWCNEALQDDKTGGVIDLKALQENKGAARERRGRTKPTPE